MLAQRMVTAIPRGMHRGIRRYSQGVPRTVNPSREPTGFCASVTARLGTNLGTKLAPLTLPWVVLCAE